MLQIFTMTGIIIMKIPMRWSAQILERFTNSVRASVYVCLMLIKKMQQLILCLQLFGDKSETGGKIWEQNP